MAKLNEQDRVTAAEMESAFACYAVAFPNDDSSEWLHPCLIGTRQLRDALLESIERRQPLTASEIERRFGAMAWDW